MNATARTRRTVAEAGRMRAATLSAPGAITLGEVRAPSPGPGQVRIRVEGCGICGSNLPLWEGRPWFEYPFEPGAPGHEGWGRVDAIGDDVSGFRPGERVAFLSHNAFAEYDLARAADVVRLPPSLDGRPFPGEALACAVNVVRRSAIQPGDRVAVVGIGFLGAIVTRLAVAAGATVVGLSRRAWARETAVRLGAAAAFPLEDRTLAVRQVAEALGGGALDARSVAGAPEGGACDVVIEATGLQHPLDVAAHLTRERGRLVIAGYHQDGRREVDLQLWNWRGLDVINAHERDPAEYVRGMRDAVAAVERGQLDPGPLLTHAFPLDRIRDGFEAVRTRPDGFLKALVIA